MERLPADTPELDKRAGALRKDLDETVLSAHLKLQLRARIEAIQKIAVDAKKAALARRVDLCLNDVKKSIEAASLEKKRFLVLEVDIGADAKASQRVMNTVKSMSPDLAFLGITEEEVGSGGVTVAFAMVPDSLVEQGFQADLWVLAALESCGGRGGGKPGNAQGQAKACSDVRTVVDAANRFAQQQLSTLVL
jgi:alanyl-tRNA synthetase